MAKVSIIVPVYGVEKYIERCARSLFEQTLDDIEYLFIDDCTPDRSVEKLRSVMEEYPKRKNQVIIHRMEQNSGQAKVREWGIKNATGEFVIHCDSDDWVDNGLYQAMYEKAVGSHADIAICDFAVSDLASDRYVRGCYQEAIGSFVRDMCSMKTSWSLCNKIIRTRILREDILFPEDNMGEDMALVTQFITKASKVVYVSNVYYHYFKNSDSITRTKDYKLIEKRFLQVKKNTDIALHTLEKFGFAKKNNDCLCVMKLNVKRQLLPLVYKAKYYKLWHETYPETDRYVWLNPYITLKDKLKYFFTLIKLYPTKKSRVVVQ